MSPPPSDLFQKTSIFETTVAPKVQAYLRPECPSLPAMSGKAAQLQRQRELLHLTKTTKPVPKVWALEFQVKYGSEYIVNVQTNYGSLPNIPPSPPGFLYCSRFFLLQKFYQFMTN